MKLKVKYVLIIALAMLILGLIYGKKWADKENIPIVTTNTEYVYDTTTVVIENDVHHYHVDIDTIFYPDSIEIHEDIDTLSILREYYATFKYNRTWEDTAIQINFTDFISQNKILKTNWLEYKILRPQVINTTENKVVNYNRYVYLSMKGGLIPEYKYTGYGLQYAGPRWTYGGFYEPWNPYYKYSFTIGFKLIKF